MKIVALQLANYTLSFLMWMIVGRALLTLVTGGRETIVTLAFVKVTEPVYAVTRKVLPFAAAGAVPALSFLLLVAARVALFLLLRPTAGP